MRINKALGSYQITIVKTKRAKQFITKQNKNKFKY